MNSGALKRLRLALSVDPDDHEKLSGDELLERLASAAEYFNAAVRAEQDAHLTAQREWMAKPVREVEVTTPLEAWLCQMHRAAKLRSSSEGLIMSLAWRETEHDEYQHATGAGETITEAFESASADPFAEVPK